MTEYTRPTGTTLDFSLDSSNSYTRPTGTILDFDITTIGSVVDTENGVVLTVAASRKTIPG